MNNLPQTNDISVFVQVVKNRSFSKAASAIGMSPAYITKRISVLEACLGVKLLHRTTRSLELTSHGQRVYEKSINVLLDIEDIMDGISDHLNSPKGHISIISSLGFGREYVSKLISILIVRYPLLKIRFDTVDQIQDLIHSQIDIDLRIGNDISPNLIAKKIYDNKRILCASPDYLQKYGMPRSLEDLINHQCIVIKERDHPFATWELEGISGEKKFIKVESYLSSNNGEVVKGWVLDGHGIMLRSLWNVQDEIKNKSLIRILPNYYQTADIWAVYTNRLKDSAKLKVCIDFFHAELPKLFNKHEYSLSYLS